MEITTNLKSQRWGSESSRTDGLADAHVYKQVAIAKLSTKQNPICLWWLWRHMRGYRATRTWWRSSLNPRMCPCWAPLDTHPIGPKSGDAEPWTQKVFVVNQ
jgi:hypothetical protein